MKVLALLFVIGLVAANSELRWETGKEYVYKYSGRLLTGFPQLAEHYSGLAINCTVHVQVPETDSLVLYVKDAKYVKVNDKLEPRYSIDGMDGYHWRELQLPQLTPVPEEHSRILSKPIIVKLVRGEIREVKISNDEPLWAVNFKKALVLQFQAKLDTSSIDLDENRIRVSDEGETYWKVKEETLSGVCVTIYQVNELPRYIIKDRPELIPYPEACTEEKYYGITKTRNLDNCEKRSKFSYFKPGRAGIDLTGNFKDAWATSSETRYITCGRRGKLVVQTIISSGEMSQNILNIKYERMITGTLQVLSLKEVKESSSQVPTSSELVPLKSLMYEYSSESYRRGVPDTVKSEFDTGLLDGRIPRELLKKTEVISEAMPRNYLAGLSPEEMKREVSPEKIIPQIKELIKEIVHDTIKGEKLSEKRLGMKVLSVARGIGLLKEKEEIMKLYSELKSEIGSNEEDLHTMKNIFIDSLLQGGTPECVYLLKELVLSGELTTVQITNIFFWLPHYMLVPTEEVLMTLFELVTNEKIREKKIVYSAAIMGYSNLIHMACLSTYRQTLYPMYVFGEFCNPKSEIVVEKWIPYLLHELKSIDSPDKRNDILVALGLMSHKTIIPHLVPIIEGSVESVTPMNRFFAIVALNLVGIDYPTEVIPILYAVASNPAESTHNRLLAVELLLTLNPPMAVLHKIAALTWRTRNLELLKTINTALYTLQMKTTQGQYEHRVLSLPKKAFLVYPLIKKIHGLFPTSGHIFTEERMKDLNLQYNQQVSYFSSNNSILPEAVYVDMQYIMDSFEFIPFRMGTRLANAAPVIRILREYLNPMLETPGPRSEKLNSEWKEVIEKLRLKTRKSDLVDGSLFIRLFEATPFFINFDKMTVEEVKEKILPYLRNPELFKRKVCGTHSLNFQRTLDMTPTQLTIPSDMGFPINFELHLPVVISVRGDLKIECQGVVPSVSIKSKVLLSNQYTGWVGTICPFTKEYVVTGVEEHSALHIPVELSMHLDVPSHKLNLNMKPIDTTGTVELIHLITRPFTASKKISTIKPLINNDFKVIRSDEKEKKLKYNVGEFLGFDLVGSIKTETPYLDFKTFADIMKLFNYNPVNQLRFPMLFPTLTKSSDLSLRYNEYKLEYNPSSASTKEIQIELKLGYGVKSVQGLEYKSLNVNDMSDTTIGPLRAVDYDEDSETIHPIRQAKIKKVLQDVNEGQALTLIYTTTLKGSRARSWTYQLTAFKGSEESSAPHGLVKQKWNIILESEGEILSKYLPFKQICLKGEVDMPILPIWNLNKIRSSLAHFNYKNIIGFGSSSCEESTILITGTAMVSNEQKEYSLESVEAKRCQQMIEKRINGAELSSPCEKTRLQAKTVDKVEFRVTYKNMPAEFRYLEARLTEALKTWLWPNLKMDSFTTDVKETPEVLCHLMFHRTTPSFDVILQRSEEKLVFKQVRMIYPFNLIFPLKAGTDNVHLALNSITGYHSMPKCKIESDEMITYGNRTLPFRIDYCFHLLTGDCSTQHKSGILIRNMKPGNRRQLKVFLGDSVIMLTPDERNNQQPFFSELKVTIESEELYVPVNTWKPLVYQGTEYGTIFRSSDNVIHLKAPKYYTEFLFDGDKATIYGSPYLKNQLCGLCGNFDHEVSGPQKCVYSSPEVEVASYHVPSSDCQMDEGVKQKLQIQRSECAKFEEYPTMLSKSLKLQMGKPCTVQKHLVLERAGKICFSKVPVTECSNICRVSPGKVTLKKVPFTCLPEGRVAEVYVKKAYDGLELPELRSLETSFESKVEQPKLCIPINPRM